MMETNQIKCAVRVVLRTRPYRVRVREVQVGARPLPVPRPRAMLPDGTRTADVTVRYCTPRARLGSETRTQVRSSPFDVSAWGTFFYK